MPLPNDLNEQAVFHAIKAQDWDRAFDHAQTLPARYDIFSRLPSSAPLPSHFVNRILDHLSNKKSSQHQNLSSFLFEMAHNLPGSEDHYPDHPPLHNDTMNRIAELAPDDYHVKKWVTSHPAFQLSDKNKELKRGSDFWYGYERHVDPLHFATIKSLYTNKPEVIKDHRGKTGTSVNAMSWIPGIKAHSKAAQKKILEDENLPKRMINGEPHVKLYRGVNGNYGKKIREKANFDPITGEADKKKFILPTAHLTSWTTDPKMAHRFVWGRTSMEGQASDQGVTMSQWIPVKSILHSGFHKTNPTQEHAHEDEQELVVGHPEGKHTVSTASMQFQPNPEWAAEDKKKQSVGSSDNYGKMITPKLRKNESIVEIIDLFDVLSSSNGDYDVLYLEDMKKTLKNFIPAATALALLGAPQDTDQVLPLSNMPAIVQEKTTPEPVQAIQKTPHATSEGLKPIKMIESMNGAHTNHQKLMTGPHAGCRAYGSYGLMPMTIMDILEKNPSLMHKYPDFNGLNFQKDNDKIHFIMKAHPQAEVDIANALWHRLGNVFGNNQNKMAHAWLNGIGATLKASDDAVNSHWYVQKYNKFKKMLDLEKKPDRTLKKTDEKKKGDFADVKKFTPFTDVVQNQKYVKDINDAITSGQIHDLTNVGKFTHSSFVAGFDPKNSWLIKVEPFGERPGIESVSRGLQTVKEVAFYYLANRIFNLGTFTPQAILGEIAKGEKTLPAAAIKMYPQVFIAGFDMEKTRPKAMIGILEKYRKSGDLHKLAIMLYILGEADSHGNNILTDGTAIKLIDHGSSFGSMLFDPLREKNVFVPYFMRMWGFKDSMDADEKYLHMPKIDNQETEEKVRHWLMSISRHDMVDILKKFYLDPQPVVDRLTKLQELATKMHVDSAINTLWTKGVI